MADVDKDSVGIVRCPQCAELAELARSHGHLSGTILGETCFPAPLASIAASGQAMTHARGGSRRLGAQGRRGPQDFQHGSLRGCGPGGHRDAGRRATAQPEVCPTRHPRGKRAILRTTSTTGTCGSPRACAPPLREFPKRDPDTQIALLDLRFSMKWCRRDAKTRAQKRPRTALSTTDGAPEP